MKKLENLIFILVIIVMSGIMFYWISQKEGFHEDEIFSYGSSNYRLDNVYQRYGEKDAENKIIFDEILSGNLNEKISKIVYYFKNPTEFMNRYNELVQEEKPIWKTNEDAKEYLTIMKEDVFNFFSVYYNQSRDVHPPLFYILVHIFSTIWFGTFSKYIIFSINLIFFILTCLVLREILKLLNKEYLSIPTIILYGLSIGAVSIMIFLRMYQMLIFFIVYSIFVHLQILKNNLEIDKKSRNQLILVTILGFLTQYYYCIFALFEFVVLGIILVIRKKYNVLKKYFKYNLISAIVGVLMFPASIYHIFFSYRGMGASIKVNIIERIIMYFKEISYSFSIPTITLLIFIVVVGGKYLYDLKKKYFNYKKMYKSMLIIPIILYFFVICLIAPQMENDTIVRYIAILLPVLSIVIVISLDELLSKIKNEKIITTVICIPVICISIYGMIYSTPRYLYKGYNKNVEIAKQNNETKFIYICDKNFTYISAMPEFLIYNKSLIINYNVDSLEILKDNVELKEQKEFILSIRKWLNYKEILNKVMEHTNFNHYTILNDSNETQTILYRIY